jgi:hypothetical protein
MSEYEGKVPYRKYARTVDLSDILYYEATGELMSREEKEKVKDIMENKKLYAISFVDDVGIRFIMGKTYRGHTIALKDEDIQDLLLERDFSICFYIYDSVMEAKEDFKSFTKPTDYEFEVIEVEEIIKPVVVGYKIKE